MVHTYTLILITLTSSALGVATQNDRRGVDVLAGSRVPSQGPSVMDLYRRQDKESDSAEVQKLEEERKAISPEFYQAWEEMEAALKAAEDAIPVELKKREEEAVQALEAAFKASHEAIPEEILQKQEDAVHKFETTSEGLSEDIKAQLEKNRIALEAARENSVE